MPGDARISRQSFRRCGYEPMWELEAQRSPPFGKSRFSIVDFLAATNQRNQYRPISVPVQNGEHGFRFGAVLSRLLRILNSIPGPLGLVEDDDALWRLFKWFVHRFTHERVDILDEGADRSLATVAQCASPEVARDGGRDNL